MGYGPAPGHHFLIFLKLSIPFMGYTAHDLMCLSPFFCTFNSLYGILFESYVFHVLLQVQLSIPFMGYDNAYLANKVLVQLLSIPFMGYSDYMFGWEAYNMPLALSIPFMGYYKYRDLPVWKYDFQFPLWDT